MAIVRHRVFEYGLFPLSLLAVVAWQLSLRASGAPLPLQIYLPITVLALVIAALEWYVPYRNDWKPTRNDIAIDASYMALVQSLVPKIFTTLVITFILQSQIALFDLWPQALPFWGQLILVFLISDFFRYWLHRWAHEYEWLWRFHRVHHSPQKMYWLNVGRFHAMDKLLQIFVDVLPFLLLGVSPEVMATYYVIYAAKGFYQHSNLPIKLGPLNYVFAGPELHRWHHSVKISEANHNYGNNIILWDLVFGSFLNKELHQEFQIGIEQQAELSWRNWWDIQLQSALNMLVAIKMRVQGVFWWVLVKKSQNVQRQQTRVLNSILSHNRKSRVMRGFDLHLPIESQTFRDRMPISNYDQIESLIEEQMLSKLPVLTTEVPQIYARTSGTTGRSKYIPLTAYDLRQQKRLQNFFSLNIYRQDSRIMRGRILAIVSPAIEGYTEQGIPFGSASGLLYQGMGWLQAKKYVLPKECMQIEDYHLRYIMILLIALAVEDLSGIATANPSTLVKLQEYCDRYLKTCIRVLETGDLRHLECDISCLPPKLRHWNYRDQERANYLRALLLKGDQPGLDQIWPSLVGIVTWKSGSCGVATGKLKTRLSKPLKIYELGYLASECKGTIPVQDADDAGLPCLTHYYFEFVEKLAWEAGRKELRELAELELGQEYYIFITSFSGLYRYDMNDIVKVTGFLGAIPLLRFVQKGKGVTSITGEKLYESQVIELVKDLNPSFYVMLADEEQAQYCLYLSSPRSQPGDQDQLADELDHRLRQLNLEYDSKRASLRLQPLRVRFVEEKIAEDYKLRAIQRGQREAQFKYLSLQYARDWDFPLQQYELA